MSSVDEAGISANPPPHPPDQSVSIPADALIIVPVRIRVLFPGMVAPITLGRPKAIAAAQQAVREQRQIGILLQRDAGAERTRARRSLSRRHRRQYRALHHGPR